jgi:hypothetical protein
MEAREVVNKELAVAPEDVEEGTELGHEIAEDARQRTLSAIDNLLTNDKG